MSNRIALACSLALLSMTVGAAPVTYTQEVPTSNGHVTVQVTVENGDFKMVKVLPNLQADVLTPGVNAENLAELESLTAEDINIDMLKGVLSEALKKASNEEAQRQFVPGTYRSVIVSRRGDLNIEFVITENGIGNVKVLEK